MILSFDLYHRHGTGLNLKLSEAGWALRCIDVCEQRDRKGLYAKAPAGVTKEFTGVSDPCEPPVSPELTLNAGQGTVDEEAETALDSIRSAGFFE